MGKLKLSVERLNVGLYIELPCSWGGHPFLFNTFKIQDEAQIKVLQSLDIPYILYVPTKSDSQPLPIQEKQSHISTKTTQQDPYLLKLWQEKENRVEEQKQYIRNLRKCENDFKQSLAVVRSINLKLNHQRLQALAEAQELISSIANKLNGNCDTVLHLMEEGQEGDKYHNHIFNVAILSMILAKALALSEQNIIDIGLGALLHDIGKSKVPDQILLNKPKVTAAENNFYKMHVQYGNEIAQTMEHCPPAVREIIAQHHEYLDGSGYPNQLVADNISLLSQIVAIANEYDNMCNPSDKHPSRTPYHVLSYLYKNKDKQLNKDVLGLLIKQLGVYPPGCIVQLSNEKLALVMSVSKNNILQPNVLIYDPSIPKSEAPIISLCDKQLKIEKVILPHKLPEQIAQYLNPRTRVHYYFEDTQSN